MEQDQEGKSKFVADIWGGIVSIWTQSNRGGGRLSFWEVHWSAKAWGSDNADLGSLSWETDVPENRKNIQSRKVAMDRVRFGTLARMSARAPACCLGHGYRARQFSQPQSTPRGRWDSNILLIGTQGEIRAVLASEEGCSCILPLPSSKRLTWYCNRIRQGIFIESKWFKMLYVIGLQTVLHGPTRHCDFGGLEEEQTIPTSTTPAQLLIALYSGLLWRLLFVEKGVEWDF